MLAIIACGGIVGAETPVFLKDNPCSTGYFACTLGTPVMGYTNVMQDNACSFRIWNELPRSHYIG